MGRCHQPSTFIVDVVPSVGMARAKMNTETTPPSPTAKSRGGRPSIYSPELAQRICDELASSSKSLRAICQQLGMPARSTIYLWSDEYPEFRELLTRAREEQLEAIADEMLQIADDASDDLMETEKGPVFNRAAIARSKIRIATRQWLITHLTPKKQRASYGNETPQVTEPMISKHLTLAEYEQRVRDAFA
jgi:transposase-like protein